MEHPTRYRCVPGNNRVTNVLLTRVPQYAGELRSRPRLPRTHFAREFERLRLFFFANSFERPVL